MNESGGPVVAVARFFKVPLEQIVVVHDELDLPFGTLRLKRGGGDGGHNGLRSIIASLGCKDYVRVRFGIGRPPGRQDPADYVLREFGAAERKELGFLVDRAADAVEAVLATASSAAQNSTTPERRQPRHASRATANRPGVLRPRGSSSHRLAAQAAAVAGERAVRADHPVARDDDRDRVLPVRQPDRAGRARARRWPRPARRSWPSRRTGSSRSAGPDALLERGTGRVQRQVELAAASPAKYSSSWVRTSSNAASSRSTRSRVGSRACRCGR